MEKKLIWKDAIETPDVQLHDTLDMRIWLKHHTQYFTDKKNTHAALRQ